MLSSIYLEHQWKMENLIRVSLGEIARRARPKLLVLYHQSLEKLPEADLLEQMKKEYSGEWVSAKDLGVY
jgi:ribonuclease BN (tRNA processing enzyme)